MPPAIPPPERRPVLYQTWRQLLFLHWEVSPDLIQQRLPPGLHVDTWRDGTYLGIVPFQMRRVHPRGLFSVPGISNFLELNVRAYVYDERGIPGVWFFSLDANQPLAVEVARRWYQLNYVHAEMSSGREGDTVRYRCRRKGQAETAEYRYPLPSETQLAEPGTLEFFLLERYYLYAWSPRRRQLCRGQVIHSPYRYQVLPEAPPHSALPAEWGEFALPDTPVHSAVAEAVDVAAYAIQPV